MDNKLSYDKTSGYGENTELEIAVIKNFFGDRLKDLEVITDKARQVEGIDYIVTITDYTGKLVKKNIDTKIHHYDSELFVFEYDDDRPNYKNRTWANTDKKTDIVIWIIPALNEYVVYSHSSLLKFYNNSDSWNWAEHQPFMDCKHYNNNKEYIGTTYNKWLPLNFTTKVGQRYFKREMNMSGYSCKVKHSAYKYNELTGTFYKSLY